MFRHGWFADVRKRLENQGGKRRIGQWHVGSRFRAAERLATACRT